MINPTDGDFYPATSGDRNLAVDTDWPGCADIAQQSHQV
jgi:hypothetical protein